MIVQKAFLSLKIWFFFFHFSSRCSVNSKGSGNTCLMQACAVFYRVVTVQVLLFFYDTSIKSIWKWALFWNILRYQRFLKIPNNTFDKWTRYIYYAKGIRYLLSRVLSRVRNDLYTGFKQQPTSILTYEIH